MNKSELATAIADELNMPRSFATSALNTILNTMSDTLERGESIQLRGFGSFVVKQYGAYEGRNPVTGEKIQVKPKKRPYFKVGKGLRKKVNLE
ncbi:MAG: integration host factor subunit beta [Desulfobulbaceae bacterium]|nr:integration host factor subunit beta [Desulfobulbaceae bacterium]